MIIKLTENAKKTALDLPSKGRKVYANTDGHLFTDENSAKLSKKEYKEVNAADAKTIIANNGNDKRNKGNKGVKNDAENTQEVSNEADQNTGDAEVNQQGQEELNQK